MGLFKKSQGPTSEYTRKQRIAMGYLPKFENEIARYDWFTPLQQAGFFSMGQDNFSETLKLVKALGDDKWFMSTDPEVIAVKQLALGKKVLLSTPKTLSNALEAVLGLDDLPSLKDIKENWDTYYTQVREKLGDRACVILGEPTKAEKDAQLEKELEDILKIDQNYWNQ